MRGTTTIRPRAIAIAALLPLALAAACGGTPEEPGAAGSPTTSVDDAPAVQGPPGPPGSILEGGRSGANAPEISTFEVPPNVACTEGETASVTVTYKTSGATTIALMLDVTQVEGKPPMSGTFAVPVPCDGDAHTIVLIAAAQDSSTNTASKVTVAGA